MDRFEASKVPKVFTRVKYLHSSMDRFEDYIATTNKTNATAFTFQYG